MSCASSSLSLHPRMPLPYRTVVLILLVVFRVVEQGPSRVTGRLLGVGPRYCVVQGIDLSTVLLALRVFHSASSQVKMTEYLRLLRRGSFRLSMSRSSYTDMTSKGSRGRRLAPSGLRTLQFTNNYTLDER